MPELPELVPFVEGETKVVDAKASTPTPETVETPVEPEVPAAEEPETPEGEEDPIEPENGAEEEPVEPETPAEPAAFDFSTIGDGSYKSLEEVNSALAEKNKEIESLSNKLEVNSGIAISDQARSFDKLVKKFDGDHERAGTIFSTINSFNPSETNAVDAQVLRKIVENPKYMAHAAEYRAELQEEYDSLEGFRKADFEEKSEKAKKEIMEIKESLKVETEDERIDKRNQIRESARLSAKDIVKDLKIDIPEMDGLSLSIDKTDLIEANVSSILANKGEVTPEAIESAKSTARYLAIIQKFEDGSIVQAITDQIEGKLNKENLIKKSHPSTTEKPKQTEQPKTDVMSHLTAQLDKIEGRGRG